MVTEGAATPPPDPLAEVREVVARAKAGDMSALPRLRALLDHNPELGRNYGNLGRQAEAAWVSLAAGSNLYLKETAGRAAEAQRAELTRPGAGPIERLLVERVVACGLQLNYFSATEANALAAGDTPRQLQFHARRLGQAERRYLSALGALTTYQRLMPAVGEPTEAGHVLPCTTREEAPAVQQLRERVIRIEQPVDAGRGADEVEGDERERLRVSVAG